MLILKRLLALCTLSRHNLNEISKLFYCNICKIPIKLLLLLICGCLLVCCEQKNTKQVLPVQNPLAYSEAAININTASAEELRKIPRVGAKTAQKIVEFRSRNGRFRKLEHLLLVDGVNDARFREMKNFVRIE